MYSAASGNSVTKIATLTNPIPDKAQRIPGLHRSINILTVYKVFLTELSTEIVDKQFEKIRQTDRRFSLQNKELAVYRFRNEKTGKFYLKGLCTGRITEGINTGERIVAQKIKLASLIFNFSQTLKSGLLQDLIFLSALLKKVSNKNLHRAFFIGSRRKERTNWHFEVVWVYTQALLAYN